MCIIFKGKSGKIILNYYFDVTKFPTVKIYKYITIKKGPSTITCTYIISSYSEKDIEHFNINRFAQIKHFA